MSSSDIVGLGRLIGRLKSLPRQVSGPIAIKAVRAGLQVQQKSIQSRATPFLRVTVGYRLARRSDPLLVRGIVGINVGRQANPSEKWAPLLVMGSVQRYRKTRSGGLASTGQIIANNIVERGIAASQSQAQAAMESVIKNALARINR
jgi:hypothetical protein